MKKLLLIVILAGSALLAAAQAKCNVNKAWAYYTVSYPGVQMADGNGNPIPPKPMIDRFIYIEWCGKKKPEIIEVLYNNSRFDAVLEKVQGRSAIPGKDLDPGNTKKITASKCKKLWKLILVPKEEDQMPEPGSRQIVIKTRTPACSFKIAHETRLRTLPRP